MTQYFLHWRGTSRQVLTQDGKPLVVDEIALKSEIAFYRNFFNDSWRPEEIEAIDVDEFYRLYREPQYRAKYDAQGRASRIEEEAV